MAETLLTPVSIQVKLVDEKGCPTPYFQRMLQQLLKEKKVTDELAEGAAPQAELDAVEAALQGEIDAVEADLAALVLDDLVDVDTTSTPPADGEALVYDSGSSLWLPGAVAGGGGGADEGILHLAHVQTAVTGAGACAAAWMMRGLNTAVSNTITGATAIPSSTVTVTIASPGVVTWTAHGLANGTAVMFSTTGALPTGLTADFTYYVINAAADTFQLSLTQGGAAVNTSGTQSGTHTAYAALFTLPAGTYDIEGEYQGIFSGLASWRSRLFNVTDGVEQAGTIGSSVVGNVNHFRTMTVKGRFTIASAKTFCIQTIASGAVATFGHGTAASLASTSSVFTNTVIRKVSASTGGGGGGSGSSAWTEVHNSNPSGVANVDIINLGPYNELLIEIRGLASTVSGVRAVQVSTNNGSSFDTTAANYQIRAVAGTEANAATPAMGYHSTNSTAARNLKVHILNLKGPYKEAVSLAGEIVYVGSSSDINAVRILNHNGGNITGTIVAYAR